MKIRSSLFVSIVIAGVVMGGITQAATKPVVNTSKNTTPLKQSPVKKIIVDQKKPVIAKPVPQKVTPVKTLSADEIKQLVSTQIDTLIQQGKLMTTSSIEALSFEKLHKLNDSYSEDKPGFQSYYAPTYALPGVGTFFSASNVSGENVNSTNLTSENAEVKSLTVTEGTSLEGGLSLVKPEQGNTIDSDSGAYLSAGGTWTNASSKELKENFTELDQNDLLEKINSLSITRWNYKTENTSTTHIGPMAEDFSTAFAVGGSAGQKAISTIDPAGVALAGIQALTQKFTHLAWLTDIAKKVGIVIEENIVKVKTLIATVIHTDTLEVGSSDLPSGITLYDKSTKQPVCVGVNNGALQVQSGKCVTVTQDVQAPSNDTSTHSVINPTVSEQPSVTPTQTLEEVTPVVPVISDTPPQTTPQDNTTTTDTSSAMVQNSKSSEPQILELVPPMTAVEQAQ